MFPSIKLTKEESKEIQNISYMGDLVEIAGKVARKIFSEKVNKLEYLIEGIDNAVVLDAIFQQNLKGIPFDKQQKLIALSSDYQQYKRAIILNAISGKNSLNLSNIEKVLINGFIEIAPFIDGLFQIWREVVVYSPLGRKMADDPMYSGKFRRDNGLLTMPYVFSVIQKGEEYREIPLIKAFPDMVTKIIAGLRTLSEKLVLIDADKELTDYIDALADLYENEDSEKYEYFSKNVDSLWLYIPGRVIPIHSCEVYEDPGKYVVSPELAVAFIDDRYISVNEGIEKTKTILTTYLQKEFADYSSLNESITLIEKADTKVYSMVLESGARLTFRPFGQNLPNWDEVRHSDGVRIIIDMNSARIRWETQRPLLVKLFGEEAISKIFDSYVESGLLFTLPAIVHVGGHEIAHNAFITMDVQERLTPPLFAKIEETKATFAVFSALREGYSIEDQKILVLSEIASDIMNLSQEDNLGKIAYVNTALLSLDIATSTKLIDEDKDVFILDLSDDKINRYLEKLERKFSDIADIYEKGNEESVSTFMDLNFVHTIDITEIAKRLKAED